MRRDMPGASRYVRERKVSEKLRGKACYGCRHMSVLERHVSSAVNGRRERIAYEEYYCNSKGVPVEPPDECDRRRK